MQGRAYPGSTVAGAIVATLFFPVLALIAALLLRGRERDEAKRRDLLAWAWLSVAWLVAQFLVFVALAACAVTFTSGTDQTDRSGPCVGGPRLDVSAEVGEDGKAAIPCEISGTMTLTNP